MEPLNSDEIRLFEKFMEIRYAHRPDFEEVKEKALQNFKERDRAGRDEFVNKVLEFFKTNQDIIAEGERKKATSAE